MRAMRFRVVEPLPSPSFLVWRLAIVLMIFPALGPRSGAQSDYYRHVLFDNSQGSTGYFYSAARAVAPSTLEQRNSRLPVESGVFKTPPNALRMAWESKPGGGWEAEIHLVDFRNRFPEMAGKNLYLWCYSQEKIAAKDLPEIVLSNAREGLQIAQFPGSFTAPEPLGKFAGDIPAARWI